ncbi:MAG TPA: glycosyltransferase family 4 protein [Rugosimonospora sp.]|nr:glycosyltransferase family 4 protein [Rugosimonospora sp.]
MTVRKGSYRALIFCGLFEPGYRGGGPIRSLAHIVDSASDAVDVTVVTSDRDHGSDEPYEGISGTWVTRGRARVMYFNARRLADWRLLYRELRRAPFDLLYVNSFWSPWFTLLPIVAASLRLIQVKKVLVAPRGELSAGALSIKARKKQVFLRAWGRFLLAVGVVWHATSETEAREVRATFPWAIVHINQNQALLPAQPLPALELRVGPPSLAFIGRISPMKNLDLVLQALALQQHPLTFDIYGPRTEMDYWARCVDLIAKIQQPVVARYRGELTHHQVRPTFAGYDGFVFPTRGENFGHVIIESLSAACPVICSDATPWSSLITAGGGRVLREATVSNLAEAIGEFTKMVPEERLRRRQSTANAYLAWRRGAGQANILDQVLSGDGRVRAR